MNGKHQVTRTVEVATDPAAIWSVIADSRLLPQWASVVKDVTYLGDGQEGVGMTRHCNVELGGRTGTMTERCVEYLPSRRAGYVVDDDTLGFRRMLVDYGFAITLEPRSDRATALRIDTYYTPRTPLYGLLNRLVLRRRMRRTVDGLLQGLKQISERRGAQAAWPARYTVVRSAIALRGSRRRKLAPDGPPSPISSTLDEGLEIGEHGRQRAGPQPADLGLKPGPGP